MTNITRLRNLTDADERAHREEALKLRRCLEQQRNWDGGFIVDVEMIRPSVHVLVDLVTGKPKRELRRGGILCKFIFAEATAPVWIGVQHWNGTQYWLHATVQPPDKPLAKYTRISTCVCFEDVGREFIGCIDLLKRESKPAIR